jgi:Flp pilus assembly pilin Flp
MKSEKGQGLPEYGLLVALISIVVNLAVIFFWRVSRGVFQ